MPADGRITESQLHDSSWVFISLAYRLAGLRSPAVFFKEITDPTPAPPLRGEGSQRLFPSFHCRDGESLLPISPPIVGEGSQLLPISPPIVGEG